MFELPQPKLPPTTMLLAPGLVPGDLLTGLGDLGFFEGLAFLGFEDLGLGDLGLGDFFLMAGDFFLMAGDFFLMAGDFFRPGDLLTPGDLDLTAVLTLRPSMLQTQMASFQNQVALLFDFLHHHPKYNQSSLKPVTNLYGLL
jgi:hypothetical protein